MKIRLSELRRIVRTEVRRATMRLHESTDFTENERRLMAIVDSGKDAQERLDLLLDEYDWAKSHEGRGRDEFDGVYKQGTDAQWDSRPYSDAVSDEISNVINEMLTAGFAKDEIEHFDTRMKQHIWW